ncbi:hypothetical protein KDW07_26955 [Burkholderia dolosa]|uniref:hypothetical protein n=1 Tax=Burkholderia dolosa TaxID=152500 RepID=UPI001B951726|nr:hypothetical protein [Burkholderia dolosa]MBR8460784.1 hypothetical protein [Burkholderia dolosa]
MTVTSSIQDVSYATDGSTTQFATRFYFLNPNHVFVDKIDANGVVTPLVFGTDYSVSGAGAANGGTVVTNIPYAFGSTLHIYRMVPVTQETEYQQNDPFPAKTTEKALDKLTMIAQQQNAAVLNSIRYPLSEYGLDGTLPRKTDRAGKILAFNEDGRHTLVPMPASVGAGDLRNESWTDGPDYTAGVSTSVQLSRSYGTKANLGIVVMAGIAQDPNSYSLVDETTLQFDAPIPAGVSRIWCVGGTTLSISIPTPDFWSLKRFGAKMDGVTDDTRAVLAAVQSGEKVVIGEPGVCVIDGTIEIPVDGFKLLCAGKRQTRFLVQNGNLPAFRVASGLTGVELVGFMIDRAVPAVAGASGISWLGSTSQSLLSDILAQNCWQAYELGPTDYSKVIRCTAQKNYWHAFYVSNIGVGGPCQWSIDQSLAQNNNGHALMIDASTGSSGPMSLGEITQFSTFANGGKGIIALGSPSNPISGMRILGGFLGNDGDDEIYLDTYGDQHKIVAVAIELPGTSPTGRNNAIPTSNLGHGISITSNNGRVQLSDPNINGCSLSGIASYADVASISNPHITNNGLANVAGDRNGVLVGAGRAMIVGGYIGDTGSLSQSYGVNAAAGAIAHITGSNLTGNTGAPTTGAGTIVESNCLP